jgi:SAM-dependent methyltransferase
MKSLEIKKHLRQWLLKGSNVYCPCCNSYWLAFWSFGKPIRFNALCPNCETVERHRLLWLFFEQNSDQLFSQTENIKLLHIAPEKFFFKKFKNQNNIDYFPADKFTEGHVYPKGTKPIDIMSIDCPDHYFDAILCNHVLEHVPDDRIAMKELFRVLRPGGWAILQVPINYNNAVTAEDHTITSPEEREKYFGQYDHLRWYGRDYPDRLREAGFNVTCIDFCSRFSAEEKIKYGLDEKDGIIYLCRK